MALTAMLWLAVLLCALLLLVLATGTVVLAWSVRRRRGGRAWKAFAPPRYPMVLVHGLMGFDELARVGPRIRYFRGVVDRLEKLGVKVYRPKLPALAAVPERAARLAAFVRALPEERVNVIAHSMGGLDARWAIAKLGLGERIASLVTIATPHRGTPLADLKDVAPAAVLRGLANRLGLRSDGLDWLTPAHMETFNADVVDDPRVLYGCVVCHAGDSLLFTNPLLAPVHRYVRKRAGTNDGIVPAASQRWGRELLEVKVDHWAQIGWAPGDARGMYEVIARELAAQGF